MSSETQLQRRLGIWSASSLVVGTIIGTGVFMKSALIANLLPNVTSVIAVWVFAGVLSLLGALTYAELGCLFPRAGGEYVYLREAYGNRVAYLYGWTRFWIGSPGSVAAYAVGAAQFLSSYFVTFQDPVLQKTVAIGFILTLTLVNCLKVDVGGGVQTFLTIVKITLLFGLMVAGFSYGGGVSFAVSDIGTGSWGLATLAALWAYDGWNNMPMAAGEIKDPDKNIPKALGLGLLLVIGIYCFINISYFSVLSFSEVQMSFSKFHPEAQSLAGNFVSKIWGAGAAALISLAFVISALGAMNGSILTGARVPFAMARDGLFISVLGKLSVKTSVPYISVLIQGLVASILALTGSFDQITDYVVFSSWIFYGLNGVSVLILRRKVPTSRVYSVPLYPLLPLVFAALSFGLVVNSFVSAPMDCLWGLIIILSGLIFFRPTSKV